MTASVAQESAEKEVLAALAVEGIDSLDALARRVATLDRVPDDEPLLSAFVPGGRGPVSAAALEHRPPEANLVVDGERLEPAAITEFNGTALYSTPGFDGKREPTLYSFTTPSALTEHLISARGWDDIGTSNPDSLSDLAYYYSNDSGGGDWLQNGPARAWRDLSKVGRGILHLGNWNDVISSVNWCRWDISLYANANYQGSQLYLRAGRTYFHLSEWGWNDRASSTVNWGRRF